MLLEAKTKQKMNKAVKNIVLLDFMGNFFVTNGHSDIETVASILYSICLNIGFQQGNSVWKCCTFNPNTVS